MVENERGRGTQLRYDDIILELENLANPAAIEGMARFGITPEKTYGVSMTALLKLAKEIGSNHELADRLWTSNIRETRILACLIDIPGLVTEEQMEAWVRDFDYWEICDQCCIKLFRKTAFARDKALAWCSREEEFVKRAGFVLIATLAVHDKKTPDKEFETCFTLIKKEARDERIPVRKAINWALRQIGKRNTHLNKEAVQVARAIKAMDSKAARWIASDALRELTSEAVRVRLGGKKGENK
jgi:3-methyladenine DNA glycosylase AlkD